MSLSVDGVWKAGAWATTVWADGVWREGSAPQVDAPVAEEAPVAYWRTSKKKRLTEEELRELVRQQRIALGILPPDLPGQAVGEPEDIANEVAAAVNDVVAMSEFPIDYRTIYSEAYREAEHAIAEYRKAKRKRKAVAFLLLH